MQRVEKNEGSSTNICSIDHDMSENTSFQNQKMEALGLVCSRIAHDNTTLMRAMVSFVELAMEDIDPESHAHEHLSNVLEAAAHATQRSKQLLAFSRSQVLKPIVTDLNQLIHNFQGLMHQMIGSQITVNRHLSNVPLMIHIDPNQMQDVLAHLISNAKDAMDGDGTLRIRTYERSECIHLEVSDTGKGIEESHLDRLFDPFFSTKEVGKDTGLGLSMVHGIIHQSGGSIEVKSRLSYGTTFMIRLPKAVVDEAMPSSSPEDDNRRCIFVVDDNEHIRTLLREVLSKSGYEVITIANPLQVAELIHQKPPGLIISDLVMPELNGNELIEAVRETIPNQPFLVITGHRNDVVLHSDVPVLYKPFNLRDVLNLVEEILGVDA